MKPSTSLLPQDLLEGFIKGLFPEGACLQVEHVEMTSEDVTLVVASTQPEGCCPLCGEPGKQVPVCAGNRRCPSVLRLSWLSFVAPELINSPPSCARRG